MLIDIIYVYVLPSIYVEMNILVDIEIHIRDVFSRFNYIYL